eukprot:13325953-Alexandrium_andersonii.AAC.1
MAGSSDHPLGFAAASRWLVDSVRRGGGGPREDGGISRVIGDRGEPGDAPVGGDPSSEWDPLSWAFDAGACG